MSDQFQNIRDDLAFMRALAEEGRRAPLIGGSIMAVAGAAFGAASLVVWATLRGWLPGGTAVHAWAWTASALVFMSFLFLTKGRLRQRPGAHAASNRAVGAAWSGAGFAIFAVFLAFVVASVTTREPIIMSLFGPVILAFYGAAWALAAAMSDRAWLKGVAAVALIACVGVASLAGQPDQFLAYAAALVLTALLPGLALMRQAPSDVI